MRVSQIMNTNVVSVTTDESATLAARLLNRHNIGSLPVCSLDGRIRGILTDRDIVLRCIAAENDPSTTKVGDIMSRGVVSVSPDDDVGEAARIMAADQVRRLPVTQDGRIVGMLSLGDMAKRHEYDMEAAKALSDISSNIKRV
ncbi:MAG: CBS domain-containing protein [Oscillospiraceae bacterium]|nr:CBS domain-containing protein [Oscillospiraceae bacterium]